MEYYWPTVIGFIVIGKIAIALADYKKRHRTVARDRAVIVRRGKVHRTTVPLDAAKEAAVEELVREGWRRTAAVSALASISWRGYPSVPLMVQQAWKSMPAYR